MSVPAIPPDADPLYAALASGDRRSAYRAAIDRAPEALDAGLQAACDYMLEAGRGSLRGSRFGRVPEVLAAAATLSSVEPAAALQTLGAAADLLAFARPPAVMREELRPGSRWPVRTEEWGRPMLVAGALKRLGTRVDVEALQAGLVASFPAPRRSSVPTSSSWIDLTPSGVVVAACRVLRGVQGFRAAAAVAVAREAFLDGGDDAVAAAAGFVEDTLQWARRRRAEAVSAPAAGPSDAEAFVEAVRGAARREAVHSFGVVHTLAGSCVALARAGSEEVRREVEATLIASSRTWSDARPPGAVS